MGDEFETGRVLKT